MADISTKKNWIHSQEESSKSQSCVTTEEATLLVMKGFLRVKAVSINYQLT